MTEQCVFAKREIALRYWLQGRGYTSALRALELLKMFEAGNMRKDKLTPATDHMIEIALHLSRLPGVRNMEEMIIVALLHDLCEDHGVPLDIVRQLFGDKVASGVWDMTKKLPIMAHGEALDISFLTLDSSPLVINRGGVKVGMVERNEDELYAAMAADPLASLGKPADRGHNQKTMGGVFGHQKQLDYVDYTEKHILPMMKIARRRFPDQEAAYEILKNLLVTQARIVRSLAVAQAA